LLFFVAAPIAAPIAAAPIAAAATTPFEGFALVAVFEAGALALEDVSAADFVEVVGFALTLPEDLAEAVAVITFFAGAFAATVLLDCDLAAGEDFAGALFLAGADFADEETFAFATGLAAGRAEDFTGAFAEDFEALDFAGAAFFAAGFALATGFVGFFVCFAIERLKTLHSVEGSATCEFVCSS
jgi:hypothetical protein